jgi:hypothetical protein
MPVDRQNQAMDFERITLRRAGDGDARALATLAELDSQRLPDDEFLIGEVAGEPWAALGIGSGVLVADPYRPTVQLAELLRLRAASMRTIAELPPRGRWLQAPKALPCE